MSGLFLHQSNRLEKLAENFADGIIASPLSPLVQEKVLVQSIGMGRWLSLYMAERQGAWAAFSYIYPNILLDTVFAIAFPEYSRSGFSKSTMHWRIFSALPEISRRDEFSSIKDYAEDAGSLRLFQFAGKCADLFDQYIAGRPDMICAWDDGNAVYYEKGQPKKLEDADVWQYLLWRSINEHAETHKAEYRRRLSSIDLSPEMRALLPSRISAFGISTLPPFHFDMLVYLSRYIDVHLYVLSPSREYIADIQSESVRAKTLRRLISAGKISDEYANAGNPLTASMGKLAADFQKLFLERDAVSDVTGDDDFSAAASGKILHRIQSDILDSIPYTDSDEKKIVQPGDISIEIQSCYGPLREVESLYDKLLEILNADSSLEPRDILVMTTDIDLYAPYIEAVFGAAKNDGKKYFIPYSITDRNIRRQGTVIESFRKILFVTDSRFTVSSVLDIASSSAVAEKFGFTGEGLSVIRSFVISSGIRWGRDERDREDACGVPFRQNSWEYGLDRLLLGYSAGNEFAVFKGILPSDSSLEDTELFSSFVSFYRKLAALAEWVSSPHEPTEWSEKLLQAADEFFAEDTENAWELSSIRESLTEFSSSAQRAGYRGEISLRLAADAILSALDDHSAQYGFLNGRVTFCALLPMRSIPFRVICILGLDDGVYPGSTHMPSFDLMARFPMTGDRSKRNDDRYIFLETILSARDKLFLSFNGRNPYDNTSRAPSVILSELMDYVSRVYCADSTDSKKNYHLPVLSHRLHSFSRMYFENDKFLKSYNAVAADVARILADRRESGQFIDKVLDVAAENEMTIGTGELVKFFRNTASCFCRNTLSLNFPYDDPAPEDDEPFSVEFGDGVEIEETVLPEIIAGNNTDYFPLFESAGVLPPGNPGRRDYQKLISRMIPFAERINLYYAAEPEKKNIDIELKLEKNTLRIRGELSGIREGVLRSRTQIWDVDIIGLWIDHLYLCACGMNAVSRFLTADTAKDIVIAPVDPGEALKILGTFSELYLDGRCRPVKFFPKTSKAYIENLRKSRDKDKAIKAAVSEWAVGSFRSAKGESEDPYRALCFNRECADPVLLFDDEFGRNASAFYDSFFYFSKADS